MTNRALYLALAGIPDKPGFRERSLEGYLLALWRLTHPYRRAVQLSPEAFLRLLELAFTAEAPAYPDAWRTLPRAKDIPGYAGWEAVLAEQVTDLREMAETGVLQEPHRYFGIPSPRRHPWYNFDPASYLECAAAGTFGAWEPADERESESTPAPCFPLHRETPPAKYAYPSLRRSIHTVTAISWDLFREFLRAGQCYE